MIYICIPAHNEEQTVGVVLWKIRQVMAEYPRDYQLLVVDDASTDRTPEVLAPYARVLPLTVVRNDSRRGEGAALEMMLREAVRRSEYPKRDIAITLQADFTQEPDELVALIKRMEAGADLVVGESGPAPDAGVLARWARGLALRLLGRSRIPEGVKDPFNGYRAYRVAVLKGALADRPGRLVHWSSWAGAAELLLATAPHARRIDTVALVERRERLQRASRQRPWRAVRDVWSLSREARPLQVASPAELDQAMRSVAAVRTSEVTARGGQRGERGGRPQRPEQGRGTSEERRGRESGRGQQRGASAAGSERPRRGERPERPERPPRAAAERSRSGAEGGGRGGEAGRAGEPGRGEGRKGRQRERPQRPAATDDAAPTVAETPVAAAVPAENGAAPAAGQGGEKKRKRPRRRKRSGAAESAQPAASPVTDQDAAAGLEVLLGPIPPEDHPAAEPRAGTPPADFTREPVAHEPDSAEDEPEATGENPAAAGSEGGEAAAGAGRSRRRRRGRRGGRRRNGAAAAEAGGESTGGEDVAYGQVGDEGGAVGSGSPGNEDVAPRPPLADAGHRPETPAQMGIFELIEGDRGNDA